jgi:hypothetical protein
MKRARLKIKLKTKIINNKSKPIKKQVPNQSHLKVKANLNQLCIQRKLVAIRNHPLQRAALKAVSNKNLFKKNKYLRKNKQSKIVILLMTNISKMIMNHLNIKSQSKNLNRYQAYQQILRIKLNFHI